jgi:hypothetical protein
VTIALAAGLLALIVLVRRFGAGRLATAAAVVFFGWWLAWAGHVIIVALAVVALAGAWFASLRISPRTAHRGGRCQGGRIYSLIWRKRFRHDAKCGGRGRVISPGAARFGTPRIRAEAAADKAAAREARRRGPFAERA